MAPTRVSDHITIARRHVLEVIRADAGSDPGLLASAVVTHVDELLRVTPEPATAGT